MKKYLLLFTFCLCPLFANAQTANNVLDKVASSLKKIKCLKSRYSLKLTENGNSSSHVGCIIIQGNKYVNYFNGTTIWFNGKTMWTLVEDNEEVTITEPSSSDINNSNPYNFIYSYKSKFNTQLINSSGNTYIIQLTPKHSNNEFNKMIVTVSKGTYQPIKLVLYTNKSTISIGIQTYESIRPYNSNTFSFNKRKYPNVDINDLR